MKSQSGLFVILTLLLGAGPSWAAPGYRLVPIAEDGATGVAVFDLNRRGEVAGMRTIAGTTRAFRWRAGQFTDLHDAMGSTSFYSQAVGINDDSTVVGDSYDSIQESFRGFLVHGTQATPLNVVAGESQVFPLDINNREQIIVDSLGGAQSGSFLVAGDNVQWLEGLPGETDSLHAVAINERGVIVGNTGTAAGTRAVLWQDGAVMDLGVVPGAASSFAYALNNRGQVAGMVNIDGGSHAMRWQNGAMTVLPRLPQEAASTPGGINDWGMIVGGTTILQPAYLSTATLWWGSHVVELDSLVRADDPLKPFVHLQFAGQINERGDIVASGVDSRTPEVTAIYFMTLFDE